MGGGGAICGLPRAVTLNPCWSFAAPSRSSFSSTRASIFALLEWSVIRAAPSGIFALEPGFTSANFPNGFDGNVRSLMLTITSPHSSRICAV